MKVTDQGFLNDKLASVQDFLGQAIIELVSLGILINIENLFGNFSLVCERVSKMTAAYVTCKM